MFHEFAMGALLASMMVVPSSTTDPLPIDASVPPPAEKITVQVVTANGSGCPVGTAAVAPSPDNTAFTVTYSNYLAQVGPGVAVTEFRKNCVLSLLIHVPSGFTYAIAQADYRGFAYLADGATALERANYYFQGSSANTPISHSFTGPLDDNWQTTDVAVTTSLVYAPCGVDRNLNVNTELRVYAGTSAADSSSFMIMDSTDGSFSTKYHFAWKSC